MSRGPLIEANDSHNFFRKNLDSPIVHAKSGNYSIKMFARLKAVVLFLVHGSLLLSILIFTLKLLSETKNEKEGIFKISVFPPKILLSTSQAD